MRAAVRNNWERERDDYAADWCCVFVVSVGGLIDLVLITRFTFFSRFKEEEKNDFSRIAAYHVGHVYITKKLSWIEKEKEEKQKENIFFTPAEKWKKKQRPKFVSANYNLNGLLKCFSPLCGVHRRITVSI